MCPLNLTAKLNVNVSKTVYCKHNSVSLHSSHALASTETDQELSAGAEMSNLPQPIMEEDAVTENQHAEATESTDDDNDDDDDDDDGNNNDINNNFIYTAPFLCSGCVYT